MLFGLANGQLWSFGAIFALVGSVAFIDLVITGKRATGTRARVVASGSPAFVWFALRCWLPVHACLIACGIYMVSTWPLTAWQCCNAAAAIGLVSGLAGGSVAHELMHGRSRLDHALAEMLTALIAYSHFCVEHVIGHHVWVGTDRDSATARMGESVYAFYPRAIVGGWRSAWRHEAVRQKRLGRGVFQLHNPMVRGLLVSAVLCVGIAVWAGTAGLLFFVMQAAIAVLVLETLNYVQHYGLMRRQLADGRFERVTQQHAWNAEAPVGNWFLLNLGHHSAHHCASRNAFSGCRSVERAPTLPTGLFGMGMLALLPALWFRVMDPLARQYQPSAS